MDAIKGLLKEFLKNIENLKGDEYVNRAVCYASIFIPEEDRDTKEILDYIYQVRREILV